MFERVLVTGGAGFIGSALCLRLVEQANVHVLNLDKLTYAGRLQSLSALEGRSRYAFRQGDICDAMFVRQVLDEFQPDTVMHLAAETHVDRSIMESAAFMQTNVIGAHVLLQAALAYFDDLPGTAKDAFRFLHVSTDEVFGSLGETGRFNEQTAYDPRSPYSASKASSDHLARAWRHTYGLPVIITNCSNNYGPRQFPEKLIPLMILRALEGKPLPVYGDGQNVRDWLHVEDHVTALILAAQKGAVGETYCIGGDNELSNIDLVQRICAVLDARAPMRDGREHAKLISFVKDRPGHDFRYAIDSTHAREALGWKPSMHFDGGLSATIDWYLANARWWADLYPGGDRLAQELTQRS